MQTLGICTKSLNEVLSDLVDYKLNVVVLKKHKKNEELITKFKEKFPVIYICPDYDIFKSWVKYLNTDNKVIVFGNLLFLSEIVNITFLDVVNSNNSSAFVKKDIDYDLLFKDFKNYKTKDYKHLKYAANVRHTKVLGDKFFNKFYKLLLDTSIGEYRNEVMHIVYSEMLGSQKYNRLEKIENYLKDEISRAYLYEFIKFLKSNKTLNSICKTLGENKRNKVSSNYSKLAVEDKGITKEGLKTIIKEYDMLERGKYNLNATDVYNDLTKNKYVESDEDEE